MWAKLAFITLFPALASTVSMAEENAARAIVDHAAACCPASEAMRGIRFAAMVDVTISDNGNVDLVAIRDVTTPGETARALAADFADAVRRCGPYDVPEGGAMTLPLAWPL